MKAEKVLSIRKPPARALSLLAIIMVLIIASTLPEAVSAGWSPEINITNEGSGNDLPSIAQMKNNDVWVVWRAKQGFPTYDLYYKVYNGTSGTWPLGTGTRLRSLSTPGVDQMPNVIQTGDGTVWVFWSTNDARSNYDIVSSNSSDYGATWAPLRSFTTDGNEVGGHSDYSPSAAQLSNGTIMVVWEERVSSTVSQICYRTAPETGSPWSAPTQLTTSPIRFSSPSVVQARNGSIIVFWDSEYYGSTNPHEITYRIYDGSSWKPERQLTNDGPTGSNDYKPTAVLTRNGSIWVFWTKSDASLNSNIVYASSQDNGNTWSSSTQITSSNSDMWPSATQGNDKKVWVAFSSDRPPQESTDVFVMTSDPLLFRDVAVTGMSFSKTSFYQGTSIQVTVAVKNRGDYPETLTVKLYANQTQIGTQTTSLPGGDSTSLVFPWGTSGFVPGKYSMKAVVDPVPNENAINQIDNTLTGGPLFLRIPGDVNADGKVNVDDLIQLNLAIGSISGQPRWNPECDINGDRIVDVRDLHILGLNYAP